VLYEGGRAEGCGNNYVLRCVINIMNKRYVIYNMNKRLER